MTSVVSCDKLFHLRANDNAMRINPLEKSVSNRFFVKTQRPTLPLPRILTAIVVAEIDVARILCSAIV